MILAILAVCTVLSLYFLINRTYVGLIFNLLWLFMFSLIRDAGTVSDVCISALATMIISFNLCYIIGRLFYGKKKKTGDVNTIKQYTLNHVFTKSILCICVIVLLYYTVKIVRIYGIDLAAIRGSDRYEMGIFSSIVDTVLFYGFAASMVHIVPMALIYCYFKKIKIYKSEVILSILICVLYIICDAGRVLIIRILLFGGAALIWSKNDTASFKKLPLKKSLLIILGVLGVLTFTTSLRNEVKISFLEQLVEYWGGAIAHMDYLMSTVAHSGGSAFGSIVYGGFLYYPIKVLNAVLGTSFITSNDTLSFMQEFKMIELGHKLFYYNALAPNAYYYYFDSGSAGVVVFSCILGLVSAIQEKKYLKPTFMNYVLFSMAVYAVAFTPLGGIFWNFRMPAVIMLTWLLRKKLFIEVKNT